MVDPYSVVGLSPRTINVKDNTETVANVKRINEFIDTAAMVGAWQGAPVRLVVIPEMAIQGMIANTPGNRQAEKRFAVTIPGPETEELGKKARELDTYIAAELYMVKDDDFPDRYYNVGFIVDPKGEVIYKRYKATSDAYEGGMLGNSNPHDVWDEFIEKKGNGDIMTAIFPVARTEIGNIGIAICHEGWRYPETVRFAARRGAELVFHPHLSEAEPGSFRPATFAHPSNTFHEKAALCRAAENTIWFATNNYASAGSPTTSAVAAPDGTVVAWQPYGEAGLLFVEIDLTRATRLLAKRCRS